MFSDQIKSMNVTCVSNCETLALQWVLCDCKIASASKMAAKIKEKLNFQSNFKILHSFLLDKWCRRRICNK